MIEKFKGGEIHYHMPNIIEGLRLKAKIDKILQEKGVGANDITAQAIEHMGPMIDRVLIGKDEAKYEDLFKLNGSWDSLVKISDKMIEKLYLKDSKKKVSKTT